MARFTLAAVLVLVLGYTEARPYYSGYHMPWYPVSPCNPYPPPPCSPYPYPCGGAAPPPPPRPTPCNPQPRPPPQPPSTYDKTQQTAEEALLTQDINVRPVRHGIINPYGVRPRRVRPLRKIPRYPPYISSPQDEYNSAHEYRALKRKPIRRGRFRGGRRMYDEGEYDLHDEPMEADEYDDGEDYGEDDGMARDDPIGEDYHGDYDNDNDDEDDY